MTEGQGIQQAIADAEQARIEHRKLGERIALLEPKVNRARSMVDEARAKLADETADVHKLESFSPTRILAGLRGNRVERLDREKAEQQVAKYAVATAEAELAQVTAEVDHAAQRRTALGDVDAAWEQALLAKEQWLATVDPEAGRVISVLSTRIGGLQAEVKELDEASRAHGQAVEQLRGAAGFLGSAKSWSTYDAWFDGGLIGDLAKHQKMDEASARMRAADAALKRLATELADVRVEPVGGLGVTDLTKTFDIWFDNIFSDFAVRNRIKESIERVERTLDVLRTVGDQLASMHDAAQTALAQCCDDREALLRA